MFLGKIIEFLKTEVFKSAQLLLVIPTIKQTKTFFRKTTTGNTLSRNIIPHVSGEKTDQTNMVEVAKDFKGGN